MSVNSGLIMSEVRVVSEDGSGHAAGTVRREDGGELDAADAIFALNKFELFEFDGGPGQWFQKVRHYVSEDSREITFSLRFGYDI